jgi:hypothetical protein
MGWGDELMAAGHAARVSREANGAPVCILDRNGQVRFHELWEGLPFIKPARMPGAIEIYNASGCRPYIQYPFTREGGHGYTDWRARDHRPVVSSLLAGARDNRGHVYIEPAIKPGANPNKAWDRWQDVVDALPDVFFMQCGLEADEPQRLKGDNVQYAVTPTFFHALRQLNRATLYVGNEGGMHHAAAALNIPAVVFFGGSCSVQATGYEDHVNLGGDDPCGAWEPCPHCERIKRDITPERVVQAIKDILQ